MSRLRISLTEWRDEGPRTPYTPTIRYTGSLVVPLTGKVASLHIPTNAERARVARAHAAYVARHAAK